MRLANVCVFWFLVSCSDVFGGESEPVGVAIDGGAGLEMNIPPVISDDWKLAYAGSLTVAEFAAAFRVEDAQNYVIAVVSIDAIPGTDPAQYRSSLYEIGLEAGQPFRRELWHATNWRVPLYLHYLPDGSLFASGHRPFYGREYRRVSWIKRGQPEVELTRCDGVPEATSVRLPDGLMEVDGVIQVLVGMECDSLDQFPCKLNDTAIFHLYPSGEMKHTCQRVSIIHPVPRYWIQRSDGQRIASGRSGPNYYGESAFSPVERRAVGGFRSDGDRYPVPALAWLDYPPGHPTKYPEGDSRAMGTFMTYSKDSTRFVFGTTYFYGLIISVPITGGEVKGSFNPYTYPPLPLGERAAWLEQFIPPWPNQDPLGRTLGLAVVDGAKTTLLRRQVSVVDPTQKLTSRQYRLAWSGRDLYSLAAQYLEGGNKYWIRRVSEYSDIVSELESVSDAGPEN